MLNKKLNILYEKLIYDISKLVKYEINESYNNILLEQYDAKDIFNDIINNASKESVSLYKQMKKLIIFVIEKLQSTNQYKKASKIIEEYKKRILKYINEHKQITPKRMFKIIVTVLTIYGGISLYQDCKSLLNKISEKIETTENTLTPDYIDYNSFNNNDIIPEETNDNSENDKPEELSNKIVKTEDINSDKLPANVYKNDTDYKFVSSKKCHDFVKKHELLLLYPYYANEKELKEGKVTIGYGHVVIPSDGDLYKLCLQLKKKGLIKQSFIYDKKKGKLILNPKHCKQIITKEQANKLFLKDIKIAENRAYRAIKNMLTDDNVKCYMLYNQNIIDGLTSLCYNAGALKHDKYSFIKKGLANCRYDYESNRINPNDYNVSFSFFKNIKDNPNRRSQEYNLFFVNANKPIKYNL